ncbi:MAG: SMC-Scp complex subunit ScpB [Chthoniobacteraceae bacterium]
MTLTIKHAVEALVFASPRPLTLPELVKAIRDAAVESDEPAVQQFGETGESDVTAALEALKDEYAQQERAFQLAEQVNGWAMTTVKEAGDWVRQLYPEAKPTRLSGPALETLAIIAYRQPVTRADIEAVRGVAADGMMQVLLDRSLVKIIGRAEVPGRPLLYATTEYFLQHFGLKTTDELPNVDELRRVALPKAEIPVEEKAAEATPAVETAADAPVPSETAAEESHAEPAEAAAEEAATVELQAESAEVQPDDPSPDPEV